MHLRMPRPATTARPERSSFPFVVLIEQSVPTPMRIRPSLETLWTPALGMVVVARASRGIMNFSQAKLARMMPVLSVTGEDMYMRSHNAFNGSRPKDGIRPVRLPRVDAETAAHLKQVFAIDEDHLRAVHAG